MAKSKTTKGADKVLARFAEEARGEGTVSRLGMMKHLPQWETFQPTVAQAEKAATFRGRVNQDAVKALMGGRFAVVSSRMVAKDIVKQWTKGTQEAKRIAVKAFFAYMEAAGVEGRFFPGDGLIPLKSMEQLRAEEHCLTHFAIIRCMMGQGIPGVEGLISHVRTWYRVIYECEFGNVGGPGGASMTSQYLKGLREFYPADSDDKKRLPVTWPMVEMFMAEAKRVRWWDVGVAIAVAFAGLFRMGELTSSDPDPFDVEWDMAERDALFEPTFWTANKVRVRVKRSKTDQTGSKDDFRPRFLPVDEGKISAGGMIREMLARRQQVGVGQEPILGAAPLFQDRKGGQLKCSAVITFMRSTMRKAGYTEEKVMGVGTHSCRIGGATRLFQLGATADVFRHMGGWVSEAWKQYVRIQQEDLLAFTRDMCSDALPPDRR